MDHIINTYEEWTDFEINKAVAIALGYEVLGDDEYNKVFKENYPDSIWHVKTGHNHEEHQDWCNNPSDMWPIILEHKISIEHESLNSESFSGGWCAMGDYMDSDFSLVDVWSENENPLRAAAIVYLKMKENKA